MIASPPFKWCLPRYTWIIMSTTINLYIWLNQEFYITIKTVKTKTSDGLMLEYNHTCISIVCVKAWKNKIMFCMFSLHLVYLTTFFCVYIFGYKFRRKYWQILQTQMLFFSKYQVFLMLTKRYTHLHILLEIKG